MNGGWAPGRYAIEAVGSSLSGIGLLYVILAPQDPLQGAAKVAFPVLLGLLVVVYGVWLRHQGMDDRDLGIVALSNVIGGGTFAVFTGWLMFVASLEFVIPPTT
ncbi:MAG: hypothetical protein ACOCY7_03960, partial [Halodesulfurarchaeum sp.]